MTNQVMTAEEKMEQAQRFVAGMSFAKKAVLGLEKSPPEALAQLADRGVEFDEKKVIFVIDRGRAMMLLLAGDATLGHAIFPMQQPMDLAISPDLRGFWAFDEARNLTYRSSDVAPGKTLAEFLKTPPRATINFEPVQPRSALS